jgi:two-component sensor histidine kinase
LAVLRRFLFSIRGRLLLLTLGTLIPAFAVVLVTEGSLFLARQAEVRDLATSSARVASSELERIIEGVRAALAAVAVAPVVKSAAPGCGAYLDDIREQLPYLTALAVTDLQGRMLCGPDLTIDVSDRRYFAEAVRTSTLVIGEYLVGRYSRKPILPLALRVGGTASQQIVIAALDLSWLGTKLRERGLPAGGSITVADRNGTIIAREPLPERFIGTKIPDQFMHLISADKAGVLEIMSQDGTPRVLGYIPATVPPLGLYLSAGLSSQASYAAIEHATLNSILMIAAGALAAFFAAWVLGRRAFLNSIESLLDTVEAWRLGNRTPRSHFQQSAGEFAVLGAALDQMMDEIEQSQRDRDLLVEELKHRAKNTLAGVRAIAAGTFKGDPAVSGALRVFLSRLEAYGESQELLTGDAAEQNELSAIVALALKPFRDGTGARFTVDGPAVTVAARKARALAMVLHELCTNAIKYGALSNEAGQVDIKWTLAPGPDGAQAALLRWTESNGPRVKSDSRKGFGTRLIRSCESDLGPIALRHDPGGVSCELRVTLAPRNTSAETEP